MGKIQNKIVEAKSVNKYLHHSEVTNKAQKHEENVINNFKNTPLKIKFCGPSNNT